LILYFFWPSSWIKKFYKCLFHSFILLAIGWIEIWKCAYFIFLFLVHFIWLMAQLFIWLFDFDLASRNFKCASIILLFFIFFHNLALFYSIRILFYLLVRSTAQYPLFIPAYPMFDNPKKTYLSSFGSYRCSCLFRHLAEPFGGYQLVGGRAEPEGTRRNDEELEYGIWNRWKSFKSGPWALLGPISSFGISLLAGLFALERWIFSLG